MNKIKQYKIIYVGGAIDHIVLPIISEFYKIYGDEFLFISTYEKPGLRVGIGYDFSNVFLPFVIKSYESKSVFKYCKKLINKAKVVIYQNVKDRSIFRARLFSNKITFKCTERFFKTPTTAKNFLRRVLGTIYHYHLFNKHNKYVLCMGGYVASDLRKAHLFKGKMLTWGYFTETTKLSFKELNELKNKNDIPVFCWVGRFVKEKQPLMVLRLAEFLKTKNVKFKIKMAGYGPLLNECKNYIIAKNLGDYVDLLGPLTLDKKEDLLNQSNYFLFTSTQEEGWGAVVNEAMGSACICITSREAGSPKTLISNNKNGYLFSSSNQDELNNLVFLNLNDSDLNISKNAYYDIQKYWNAETAVMRLSIFIENLLNKNGPIYEEFGPCSNAFNDK